MHRVLSAFYTAGLLSEGCYAALVTMCVDGRDNGAEFASDFADAVLRVEYYKLLERIERGEQLINAETDPVKREGYIKFMAKLLDRLESGEGR